MSDFLERVIGKTFNYLTIVEYIGQVKGKRFVMAKCKCGSFLKCNAHALIYGGTKSCGCYHIEKITKHGLHNHSLHRVWNLMKNRCYNPKDKNYNLYGGNGVTVCEEWKDDFKVFYDWAVANGWKNGLQLDKDSISSKIEVKTYSPSTCCFVTRSVNNRHKVDNRIVEYNGFSATAIEWSERLGMKYETFIWRLNNFKGDKARIFTTPVKKMHNEH